MTRPLHRWPILRLALGLAIGFGGLGALAAPATAQLTTTVSPSVLELQGEPGATGEQAITTGIQGSEGAAVTARITPYATSVDVPSAVDWLTLDSMEATIDAGGDATFTVDIAIPEDARPGGHYAAVTLGVAGTGDPATATSGENQASIQGRFIVPVLIRVGSEDDFTVSAELDRIAPVLEQDGRIGIWGAVTNSGSVDIRAPGKASVEEADGQPVAALDFPDTTPILPGETQIVRATGTLPLTDGAEYRVDAAIDYGGDDEARADTAFSLAALAPTGDLAICENLDRGPTVTLHLVNGGEIGFTTQVGVMIDDESGSQVVSESVPDLVLLWPQDSRTVATDAPTRLESGSYTLHAVVQTGAGDTTSIDLPFDIGGTADRMAPLCPAAAAQAGN